jgi:AcrR family transcriptional regulator
VDTGDGTASSTQSCAAIGFDSVAPQRFQNYPATNQWFTVLHPRRAPGRDRARVPRQDPSQRCLRHFVPAYLSARAVILDVIVENMSLETRGSTSERLLEAAADLLREGGIEAVSTRAVAAAAGTQPPILYRRFGDKDGLLEAVTLHVLEGYIVKKRSLLTQSEDSVADLRRLWDLFVAFGFTQPACFALIYGNVRRGEAISAAAETTVSMLQGAIERIADDGRLRMSVERATALFQSCGVGFVITQLMVPAAQRDQELSDIARENALASIMVTSGANRARKTLTGRATALRQAIGDADAGLTPAERALMVEWLDRIADKRRR